MIAEAGPPVAVFLGLLALVACSRHGSSGDAGTPDSALDGPSGGSNPLDARAADTRFRGRIGAIAWEVKIHEQPNMQSPMVGYLRAGAVVPSTPAPVSLAGCSGGWYEIPPTGFVCVEANAATTDLSNPIVRALSRRPDPEAHLPYMYGLVRQRSQIYTRLPSRDDATRLEPFLDSHMERWFRVPGENGASFRADYWMRNKDAGAPPDPRTLWDERTTTEVPDWVEFDHPFPGDVSGKSPGWRISAGHTLTHQGFAFVETAVRDGRRYAITTDLLAVPVDRMRPIEGSSYHGVRIPEDIDVPFALIRHDGGSFYRSNGAGMDRVGPAPRRAVIKLSGKERLIDNHYYYETTDDRWVCDTHASRVGPLKRIEKWARDGERWIDVRVGSQTLVAFDGTKPVYATLVSTGEAGLQDPETTKSTVVGDFRVYAKHITTTMASEVVGEEFELKDIPYVQYFREGYALHAAYWHDDFGTPRSHGCVNLAPEDARWLFWWTSPTVFPGWHGARVTKGGTVVSVHP
ncbi:MAG: L,D-transpeptidase [Polyangiaceae bacterium]